jgi:hypothetical protein
MVMTKTSFSLSKYQQVRETGIKHAFPRATHLLWLFLFKKKKKKKKKKHIFFLISLSFIFLVTLHFLPFFFFSRI